VQIGKYQQYMSTKFKSKLFYGKSGIFESIGLGVQDPNGNFHISGRNFILNSGDSYFDNRPIVSGSPVMVSGDSFYSTNSLYNFKIADDGSLVISDNNSTLATIESTGLANRVITLPNKDGVIATLEDITASAGDANSIVSQDGSKRITLNNVGELEYQHGINNEAFSLPADGGTIGLRGGDTYFGSVPPEVPYPGLRWIDTELGKSFDWLVDSNNIGAWFESSVGTDGRSVSLRVSDGYIQWQYVGDFAWNNLIALDLLKGDTGLNGSSVELRVTASHIQWKLVTSAQWNDLVDLGQITGPVGSVTSASISAALGYTPDDPSSPRPPESHNHDDRYYTESEIDTKLLTKQAAGSYSVVGHTHDAGSITSGVFDPARIPAFTAANQVVSSGNLSALTSQQQTEINTGTVVITSDGNRYVYKGTGTKTLEASYILLADITPTWSLISEKPGWVATFDPTTYTISATRVVGLSTVATSASYNDLIDKPQIPAAQINADWNATAGITRILNKPNLASVAFSGNYEDLINRPEQKIRRTAWDSVNLYSYIGTAAFGTADNIAAWTITRIDTTSSGLVDSVAIAIGAWTNRANLF
jgi:hypothetical protein